jgi:hypothetical protein
MLGVAICNGNLQRNNTNGSNNLFCLRNKIMTHRTHEQDASAARRSYTREVRK